MKSPLSKIQSEHLFQQPWPASAPMGSLRRRMTEKPRLMGKSAPMQKLKALLQRVAAVDSPVLITGETGTGKELAAQAIHRQSVRRAQPLVSINCAALPEGLLESELFGYERGAFTGAQAAYGGKLKAADGGTVFLDEIGDMSLGAQAKMLRFIETQEIYPRTYAKAP
jgi:transcriptional regulator with PAS, ATPase and Fis domain